MSKEERLDVLAKTPPSELEALARKHKELRKTEKAIEKADKKRLLGSDQ